MIPSLSVAAQSFLLQLLRSRGGLASLDPFAPGAEPGSFPAVSPIRRFNLDTVFVLF